MEGRVEPGRERGERAVVMRKDEEKPTGASKHQKVIRKPLWEERTKAVI